MIEFMELVTPNEPFSRAAGPKAVSPSELATTVGGDVPAKEHQGQSAPRLIDADEGVEACDRPGTPGWVALGTIFALYLSSWIGAFLAVMHLTSGSVLGFGFLR